MRTWHILSAVAVALVAAGVTVASIAYAAEFSCIIPWSGATDCGIPKFTIHPQETLTIKVTSVKTTDGKDVGEPCPTFEIIDVNNSNTTLVKLMVCAGTSSSYKNERKETDQTVQLRVNIDKWKDVAVQGSYTITK